jgi:hypothetical protein
MHFDMKSYLKSTHNHTVKHAKKSHELGMGKPYTIHTQ